MKVSFTLENIKTKGFTDWLTKRVKQEDTLTHYGPPSPDNRILHLGFPEWGNPMKAWNQNLYAVGGRYLASDEEDIEGYHIFIAFDLNEIGDRLEVVFEWLDSEPFVTRYAMKILQLVSNTFKESRENIQPIIDRYHHTQEGEVSEFVLNTPQPVNDPTDQRILDLVTADLDLTDQQIGQIIGISRQAANARRNKLKSMGYRVR